MTSQKQTSNKQGNVKNKNIFMRLFDWIAAGAEKAEKRGGQCSS